VNIYGIFITARAAKFAIFRENNKEKALSSVKNHRIKMQFVAFCENVQIFIILCYIM